MHANTNVFAKAMAVPTPLGDAQSEGEEDERVAAEIAAVEAAGAAELYLNYRHLRTIPAAVVGSQYCQTNLRKLYLKRNVITEVPCTVWLLRNLKELYLHSNQLKELPAELSLLLQLESVNVACNDLTTIPSSLGEMSNLRLLDISRNSITHLPDELWSGPHLEQLLASSNQLSSLPAAIVLCQSLQTLALDHNHLSLLPVQVTKLTNLRLLSVCGNRLLALPSDFSALCNLQVVYADNNVSLHSIPASLTGIETIGLQGCDVAFSRRAGGRGMGGAYKLLGSHDMTAPLTELAARAVHSLLRGVLHSSSPSLWNPSHITSTLHLPESLAPWLVPRGCCVSPVCGSAFFHYRHSYLVSAQTFKNLGILPEAKHCNVSGDICVGLDFCSWHCVQTVLTDKFQ